MLCCTRARFNFNRANFRQSLQPDIAVGDIREAYIELYVIARDLDVDRDDLVVKGLSCVDSVFPDRKRPDFHDRYKSWPDADLKYLKQVAWHSPNDPKLAAAYRLAVAVAESAAQMQSTFEHLNEEKKAISGLVTHLDLWLLPRCISRCHATRRGLDSVKKWKCRQRLEDDVQLWKVMGQHRLRDEIREFRGLPKMPNCEGKMVAKVGYPHRRRGYTWDIQ